MSSILKLEISGIRSFGPNTNQAIEFEKPLTVISGANGCGKTTIIECLKYSTTGLLPPNSKKGQLFVHDPKMSNVVEVKAQVKLLFETRAKQKSFVGRNLCLTQKRNKQEFKAMDMVMKTRDPQTGRDTSQTNKCSEMDKLIPTLLGVSRAILENVIFCHQEDSNWPLQEGSVLKRKFDDIFESSRYTKALEALRSEKKSMSDKLKDAVHNIKLLSTYLTKFEDLTGELELHSKSLKNVNSDLDGKNDELSILTAKGKKFQDALNSVAKYKEKIARYQVEIKTRSKLNELDKAKVGKHLFEPQGEGQAPPDLNHFEESLKRAKKTIESEMNEIEVVVSSRVEVQQKVRQIGPEIERIITLQAELESKRSSLIKLEQDFKIMLSDCGSKYGFNANIENEQDCIHELQGVMKKRENALASVETELKQISGEIDEEVMKHKTNLNLTEKKIRDIEESRTKLLKQKAAVEKRLQELKSSTGTLLGTTLEQTESAIKASEERLQSHLNDGSTLAKIEDSLRENQEAEKQAAIDLDNIKSLKSSLEAQQDKVAVITSKKSDLQAQISVLVNDKVSACLVSAAHIEGTTSPLEEVRDFLGAAGVDGTSSADIQDNIERAIEQARELDAKVKDQIEDESANFSKCQELKNRANADVMALDSKKQEAYEALQAAREEQQELIEALPKLDFLHKLGTGEGSEEAKTEHARRELEEAVQSAQEDFHYNKNSIKVIERLCRKMREKKCCPLCTQKVSDDFEKSIDDDINIDNENIHFQYTKNAPAKGVDAAVLDILKQAQGKKGKLKSLSEAVEKAAKDLKAFEKHAVKYMKCVELREKTIPTIKAKWDDAIQKLDEKKQEANTTADEFARVKDQLDAKKQIERPCEELLKDIDGLRMLSLQIVEAESSLGGPEAGRGSSLKEVRKQYEAKESDKYQLQQARQALFEDRRKFQERSQHLEKEVQTLRMKVYEQKEANSAKTTLTTERNDLETSLTQTNKDKNELQKQLPTLKKSVNAAVAKKDQSVHKLESRIKESRKELSSCEQDLRRVQETHKVLSKSQKGSLEEELKRSTEERTTLQAKRKEAEAKVAQLLADEKRKGEEVSTAKSGLQTLEQCIQIMRIDQDIAAVKDKMTATMEKMKSKVGQTEDAEQKLVEINEAVDSLRLSRERLRGERSQLESRVAKCKTDLKDNNLRNIETKYQNGLIEKTTLHLAVQDLDRYYKALDAALVQFHAIKIKQINEQIRELWQLTYRGGDIDRIEVRADKSNSRSGTRSYNYRVVMCKGSTELDMRGRCSAGQKVLASLVIRMALASSFSAACGILALDEPTTNLDVENKRSLAIALAQVIKDRSNEASFQLVIITHDEEFVDLLKENIQTGGGTAYYEIKRELNDQQKFVSTIRKVA